MKRLLLAAVVLAALPANVAAAATRTATTTEGVRMTLRGDGRTLALRVPESVGAGATVEAACGREAKRGRTRGRGFANGVRPGQRVRIRLEPRPRRPEWCYFTAYRSTERSDAYGVAELRPRTGAAPPARLQPGPGVAEAVTRDDDRIGDASLEGDDGDARFLLSGPVVTVELARPLRHSLLVGLACGSRADGGDDPYHGFRWLAAGAGRRVITADLGAPSGDQPRWCVLENALFGGDIVAAAF